MIILMRNKTQSSCNWKMAWLEQKSSPKRDLWCSVEHRVGSTDMTHEGTWGTGELFRVCRRGQGGPFSSCVLLRGWNTERRSTIASSSALYVWMEWSVVGSLALMDSLILIICSWEYATIFYFYLFIPHSCPLRVTLSNWWLYLESQCTKINMWYFQAICIQLNLCVCVFRLKFSNQRLVLFHTLTDNSTGL